MHQLDILPFPLGSTYSQNGTPGSTDGQEHEGKTFWVEDWDYSLSPPGPYAYYGSTGAGSYKLVQIVRNVSGVTLQPGRLVTYKLGVYGKQVDGYCTTTAQEAHPVDDAIPYSVPNNDLFYIVLQGTTKIYTGRDGASANSLANATTTQTVVVALTAATSQSTTAGRMSAQDLTGATAVLGNQLQNRIGVALSARTTNNTQTLTLVRLYNNW